MKKDEIKASLTRVLFDVLSKKAMQHQLSFQAYVSELAFQATRDERVIRSIAAYFRRSFQFKQDQLFFGRVIAPKYDDLLPDGKLAVRRSLKLPAEEYLRICEVASALACPPAKATTILLFAAHLQKFDIEDTEDAKDSETLQIG